LNTPRTQAILQKAIEIVKRDAKPAKQKPQKKHSATREHLPQAECNQLITLFNAGNYDVLEHRVRMLLQQYPNSGFAWKALGASLRAMGKEAIPALQKATQLLPDDEEAHSNLGNVLQELGDPGNALLSYQRALQIKPDLADAHCNLGNALHDLGQLHESMASYRRALQINPDFAEACANLGNALRELGQFDEAVAYCQRALEIKPNFGPGHIHLGNALLKLGQPDKALASYRKALAINPDSAEAFCNLGNALQGLGQLTDAVESYRSALRLKPGLAEAHSNIGNTLLKLGQLDQAVSSCRRALEIKPDFAEAHCYLGTALQGLGQLDNAIISCRKALEIKPDSAEAHSNLLFCLSHSETINTQVLFAEHRRFAEQFEALLRNNWPQHKNSRDPQRCLQIGFVSGDFYNHAVAFFIEPVLAQLANYPQLSLHAYYNHSVEDDVTQRLRGSLAHWHSIVGLSDTALTQKIQDDEIDILVDLSGHTSRNRLLCFASKPAPIQITWIGYPNTTGLQAMDYVLCDRFNAPHGLYEHLYIEKFARLPSSGTFAPEPGAPEVNTLPALTKGYITFASFNRTSKLGDQVIAAWSSILRALPESRLLLGNVSSTELEQILNERFGKHGIASERITFHPKIPLHDYLALHHEVDVILDTWPYTGGTTTNHALWMGVPVVTLLGPTRAHCQSAAVLGRLGLEDWVARDVEGFVKIATHWANSPQALASLRSELRHRWQAAPLRQPATVARGLEKAIRLMWQRWCVGDNTTHFEIEAKDVFDLQSSD
jgi:predicted O-linked N-acetylglucosamine transferase (SPINDLY family)